MVIYKKSINIVYKILNNICKKNYSAFKRIIYDSLPRYLIIILKRFIYNNKLETIRKINDFFSFPNILDMNNCTNDFLRENKYCIYNKYNLNTVIIHDGDYNNGHYYSLIKDLKLSKWFVYNNKNVNFNNENEISVISFGGVKDELNTKQSYNAYINLSKI